MSMALGGADGLVLEGPRVMALREALGLSRQEFAEELGVTRVTVRNLERSGSYRPSRGVKWSELERVFGLAVEDLTTSGRPLGDVAQEVWRKGGGVGRLPIGGGFARPEEMPTQAWIEGVAARRGGRFVEWRNRVELSSSAIAAAQKPVALYVEEPFVVAGEQIEQGGIIVLDRARPWTSGRIHLFRWDLRLVLERCTLEGSQVSWTDADAIEHRVAQRSLVLEGVMMGWQPGYRPDVGA